MLELLLSPEHWLWAAAAAFLLSLAIGSFLNVVIHRLPMMMKRDWAEQNQAFNEQMAEDASLQAATALKGTFNLSKPASRCPHCSHKIRAWENIPVFSYLLLRAKCSNCQDKISLRYPLVELFTALLCLIPFIIFGPSAKAWLALPFIWCLMALTMIDTDEQLLPDSITLPLLWVGLMVNTQGIYTDLQSAVWGAIAGYMSLWLVYWSFKLLTGKEGMGYGDFKLLAALGAWLGWQALPITILLSSLVGAVVGIAMIVLLGRDRQIPIPFGPYLAAAGFIAMFWGDSILQSYTRFAGF